MSNDPTSPAVQAAASSSSPAVPATADQTRSAFVRRGRRGYTSVRHVFVQKHGGTDRRSTLARFCRNRKKRALVLYLLLLTVWEADASPLRSEVWLRGLNVDGGKVTWSKSSLSTAWSALVDMGMATRTRTRRMADLKPLQEDGHEAEYTLPDGKTVEDRYFALPGEFWTEKWFDTLSLPGICVLLIVLKETNDKDQVHLTYPQFDDWYGVSASSAQKGVGELVEQGLLDVRVEHVTAALAAEGFTQHHYYKLTGPFSTASRATARAEAAKGAKKNATPTSTAGKPLKRPVRKSATAGAKKKTLQKAAASKATSSLKKPAARARSRKNEET